MNSTKITSRVANHNRTPAAVASKITVPYRKNFSKRAIVFTSNEPLRKLLKGSYPNPPGVGLN